MKRNTRWAVGAALCLVLLMLCGCAAGVPGPHSEAGDWPGLPAPQGHAVSCPRGTSLEKVAPLWFGSLFEPYQRAGTPQESRVESFAVTHVEQVGGHDEGLVLAQFSFVAAAGQDARFEGWDIAFDGHRYFGVWIIAFITEPAADEGEVKYTAHTFLRPAAFDLEAYVAGGQREWNEYEQEHLADRPYQPAAYPYKIENGACYVSYNAGVSWVETPLPLDKLDHFADGRQKTNELQAGSYFISPQKTVILYGGVSAPLSCLYSDDLGRSWSTVVIEGAPEAVGQKFVCFPNENDGFIAVGYDGAMSWMASALFSTADGGESWQYLRDGPGDHAISSMNFLDGKVGFISYANGHLGGIDLCRTGDGGINWYTIELEIAEELQPFFTRAGTPFQEGDALVLLVGEDAMSDYSGLQNHYLRYVSTDDGWTWQFEEIIEKEVYMPG